MLRYITKSGGRDRPILRGATVHNLYKTIFFDDRRTNNTNKNCYYVIFYGEVIDCTRLFEVYQLINFSRFQGILRSHSFSFPTHLVGTKITQSRPVNNDRRFKRTVISRSTCHLPIRSSGSFLRDIVTIASLPKAVGFLL